MDIHNYKGQMERQIELIGQSPMIKENKKVAIDFKNYLISDGIGIAKINRYLQDLRKLDSILKKRFSDANKDDIRRVVASIEQLEWSALTKKGFKILLRKLYRFIRGIEQKGEYPPEVKWISIAVPKCQSKLPDELLTEEEMKAMISACTSLRDRAFLATLAESGCRISEIGTMQIKHVSFEEHGARLTVRGKTGMRKVLVINSTPYLQEWLNQHPKNNNPEAYLWHSQQTEFLCYARLVAIIKQSAKRAGIKKRVHAHLFRHSRATIYASFMPEATMKNYFGWGQDSKMCGIYIHMNGEATDNAILKANGIEVKKQETKNTLQPKKCLRCSTINEVTNRYCKLCGLPLIEEEAKKILQGDSDKQKVETFLNKLADDPEFLEFISKKKIEAHL